MSTPETPSKLPLVSVQEALNEAALESQRAPAMQNFSVRLPAEEKALAEKICFSHGTNLGAFLRFCVLGLVSEYAPQAPKPPESA